MRPSLTALLSAGTLLLCGCINSYSGFNSQLLKHYQAPAPAPSQLRYSILGNSLLSGSFAVREVLDKAPFSDVEELPQPAPGADPPVPIHGLYVRVKVANLPPSLGSGVSIYVSAALLFLIPAWSNKDGSDLWFDVYRDGVHQKRFEYQIHRHTFVWILTLPILWINFFTSSEHDAFEAVTKQFLLDSAAVMRGQALSPSAP